jgi:hypothetical protein
LQDRLKGLNQGKELTPFEKKLVEEWDPKKKDNSVVSLSPIMAVDRTGTNGPPGVQGYRVERGEADSNYRRVSYYDRDGNELLQGPTIQKQKMMTLKKSEHPQDMVPGEYFEAEKIHPGTTNETKTGQSIDFAKGRLRSEQQRHATKSGLEERLIGLNSGKELTPFEKKIVEEWDPNAIKSKNDAIGTLSPILKLDSTGTKGGTEVEGYKVVRGSSGDQKTTYYDRHGNEILGRRTGGEAISTDGPMDYIAIGRVAGKFAVNAGKKVGEKLAAKEAIKAEADAVAKAEANAVAKAEANVAAKAEANTAVKTETNAAKNSTSGSQSPAANNRADAGTISDGETNAAAKQAASGHKPTKTKSEPASNSRRTSQKEDAEEAAESQQKVNNRRKGKDGDEDEVANTTQSPTQNQNSPWRQGSGTSVHTKPSGSAPTTTAGEFTAAEEKQIKEYMQRNGLSRTEAEDLVKYGRPHKEHVELRQPNSPNDGGTTRVPDWQKPGSGKRRP